MEGYGDIPVINGVGIPPGIVIGSSAGGDTSYGNTFTEASSSSNPNYAENTSSQPVPVFVQQQVPTEKKEILENPNDESKFVDSSDTSDEESSSSCVFSSSGSDESPEEKVKKQSRNLNLQFAEDVEDDLFGSDDDSNDDQKDIFNFSTKSPMNAFQPPETPYQEPVNATATIPSPQNPPQIPQQKQKVINVKSRVTGWLQFQLPDIPVPDDTSYVALLRTQFSDEALLANAKKNS